MSKKSKNKWLSEPEKHDYPAAQSYLTLLYDEKIAAGKKLSPLLLVRDPSHGKLIIADGYHRMCAVYLFDEDPPVPCKIV